MVCPARSLVTVTISVPPLAFVPKLTVLLAPTAVESLPPSTVDAPGHFTAVPSAAVVAKVMTSPIPAAWMV